jgi:hypothetical protein
MYLVRVDNRTLFELGRDRNGLHAPLQELQDQQTGTFVLGDEDVSTLGEFLLDGILDDGQWKPGDYRNFAGQLAWRMNRFAGGEPVRVMTETGANPLLTRGEDPYVITDSRYAVEWLYYDTFMGIDRTVQEQISAIVAPSTFPAVVKVRKYQLVKFANLDRISVSRANPDRSEGAPIFAKVSLREQQEEFLDEMQKLVPYSKNPQCGFWGCEMNSPHDHGVRDTAPGELRFCGCQCHDGVPIFCSCFGPCCHENGTPRAEQTPRPTFKGGKIGDFKTFTMPVIRPEGGFPELMPKEG